MPKMKTKKAAAKRFRVTGSGKIMRAKAFKSHLMSHKPKKMKRNLDNVICVDKADVKVIKKGLGIG